MSRTRTRLGDPRAQSPGDSQILDEVCTQIRSVQRFKQGTGNPWSFGTTYVDVANGEETYQINAANFGTPLAVLTSDPSNPSLVVRRIPFYCPQNLNFDWGFPQNWGAYVFPYDGSNCTASRCSIYWQNNLAYIQFQPIPQLPASYKIQYLTSANGVNELALEATPLPEQDCDVVVLGAAKNLLALSEWWDGGSKDGREQNAERRRNLDNALASQYAEVSALFQQAQFITEGPAMGHLWSGSVVG
jgi:hypothetical protein